MKKTVILEGIDPIAVYGAGNRVLEEFLTYFPGIKAVARGNEILVEGTQEKTAEFEKKFGELVARARRRPGLNSYDVESLFDESSSSHDFALHAAEGAFRHLHPVAPDEGDVRQAFRIR